MTLAELKDLVQIGVGLLTLVGGGFGLFKLGRTNASRHAEHAQALALVTQTTNATLVEAQKTNGRVSALEKALGGDDGLNVRVAQVEVKVEHLEREINAA